MCSESQGKRACALSNGAVAARSESGERRALEKTLASDACLWLWAHRTLSRKNRPRNLKSVFPWKTPPEEGKTKMLTLSKFCTCERTCAHSHARMLTRACAHPHTQMHTPCSVKAPKPAQRPLWNLPHPKTVLPPRGPACTLPPTISGCADPGRRELLSTVAPEPHRCQARPRARVCGTPHTPPWLLPGEQLPAGCRPWGATAPANQGQRPSAGRGRGLRVRFRRRGERVGTAAGGLQCRQGPHSGTAGTLVAAVPAWRCRSLPSPRCRWCSTRAQLLSSTQWLLCASSWHRSLAVMSTGVSTTLHVPSSLKILTSCNTQGRPQMRGAGFRK